MCFASHTTIPGLDSQQSDTCPRCTRSINTNKECRQATISVSVAFFFPSLSAKCWQQVLKRSQSCFVDSALWSVNFFFSAMGKQTNHDVGKNRTSKQSIVHRRKPHFISFDPLSVHFLQTIRILKKWRWDSWTEGLAGADTYDTMQRCQAIHAQTERAARGTGWDGATLVNNMQRMKDNPFAREREQNASLLLFLSSSSSLPILLFALFLSPHPSHPHLFSFF